MRRPAISFSKINLRKFIRFTLDIHAREYIMGGGGVRDECQ